MKPQPYQIFFPLGVFYSFWGALLWVCFALGQVSYPGVLHAQIMMGGFLFAFALGFLMTAVPKFLGTREASLPEVGLALGLSLSMGLSALLERGLALRPLIGLATLLFLAVFFGRRFRQRQSDPPPQFLFIPLGLICGAIGGALLALGDSGRVGPEAYTVGRMLLFQGTMLCLTLGVGGRLVTALLGWSELPTPQPRKAESPRSNSMRRFLKLPAFWQALMMVLGFALEAFGQSIAGRLVRAGVASWVAFGVWRLHRFPLERTTLARGLWLSCWFLLGGVWVHALIPSAGVHGLHLLFIGGFGLMSLLIGTHVSIVHGDHDPSLEERSWSLRFIAVFIALAALTRASAYLVPSYIHRLGFAAAFWITGGLVWAAVFLPKVIRHAPSEEAGSDPK